MNKQQFGTIQYLDWDSEFFNFPVAKLHCKDLKEENLEFIKATLKNRNFRLLYLFIDEVSDEQIHVIENLGIKNLGSKVTLSKKTTEIEIETNPEVVSWMGKNLNTELQNLAIQSGVFSRFSLDEQFPIGSFNKLYKTWIEKSLSGEIADEVLVYISEGVINGFITIGNTNGIGDIGLLSVDSKARGQSIGTKLLNAANNYLRLKNIAEIKVVTQGDNLPALNFYMKNGFHQIQKTHIFHLWQ